MSGAREGRSILFRVFLQLPLIQGFSSGSLNYAGFLGGDIWHLCSINPPRNSQEGDSMPVYGTVSQCPIWGQSLWSKQQRKNGPIFSCSWFWFCFLVFSKWWGKPASSACFQFQGRRLQPNVQQGKIRDVFTSYQAMYSSVWSQHWFAAMWARTTPS